MQDDLFGKMLADLGKVQNLKDTSTGQPKAPAGDWTADWPAPRLGDHDPATYPFNGEWFTHQARALREADQRKYHAWWLDPGAGKTGITIGESSVLYRDGKIDGLLIIAPNAVHQQWITEQLPKWCAVPWHGTYNKAPKREANKFFDYPRASRMGVLSMNYEALRTAAGKAQIRRFVRDHPRFYMAIDESHKLKGATSQRTEQVMQWSEQAAYIRLLSGTPILKGIEDLFMQYQIMDWSIIGHTSYTAFKNRYCLQVGVPGHRFAKMIVGYQNETELKQRIAPVSSRVLSNEFMKLEEPLVIPYHVDMTADQVRAYSDMKNELLAEVDNGTITVSNALSATAKLLQASSGFMYDADGVTHWFSDRKIEATLDILEGLDEPVIVWAPWKGFYEKLHDLMPKGTTFWDGPACLDRWDRILVANQASGAGVGMNLQRAAAAIYMSNPYAAEPRWQSIYRIHRIGQERQCRIWDVICRGSKDAGVLASLAKKKDLSIRTVDNLRSFIRE